MKLPVQDRAETSRSSEPRKAAAKERDDMDVLPKSVVEHRKSIIKMIETLSRRYSRWQVFQDFVTMSAAALSNAVDLNNRERREAMYMECVKRYSKDELALFPKMFMHLVMAMQIEPRDVMGEIFMEMELGNSQTGQFFTPMSICHLMAKLNVDEDIKKKIAEKGYITLSEPACGGGAMVIAYALAMREQGINYQNCLHVTATDVDHIACKMAYVQFTLLHIPAVVVHGNTLTLVEHDHWYTPAHILNLWGPRLNSRKRIESDLPPAKPRTIGIGQTDQFVLCPDIDTEPADVPSFR